METIFKKGDKVFDMRLGWGNITDINELASYPIVVEFNNDIVRTYTLDGRHWKGDSNKILSFTEYTLQGFSQERPKEFLENRWYKSRETNVYGFFKKIGSNIGFLNYGYADCVFMSSPSGWTLIDESNCEELKELLTKEAIKRGFVRGCVIKQTGINSNRKCTNDSFTSFKGISFYNKLHLITNGWDGYIFYNGEWADLEPQENYLISGSEGIADINGQKFKIKIIEKVN